MTHLKLVSSTTRSSGTVGLPEACVKCGFRPAPDGCACSYIAGLRPGGRFERLVSRATRMAQESHEFDVSCPCPWCYMQRLWSFAPPAARPERKDL